jgi:hypothetical protein
MNRIDLLNKVRNEKNEWTYMIALTKVIEELLSKNSPINQLEIYQALHEEGYLPLTIWGNLI